MPDFMDHVQELLLEQQEHLHQQVRFRCVDAPLAQRDLSCAGCGDEIDPRRLAILPHATRCVRCESGVERHA